MLNKKVNNMETVNANKIFKAEEIANNLSNKNIKYIRKDKGLMEREENENKIILAEDNRQILLG